VSSGKSGKEEVIKVSRSFTEWFDAKGHFIAQPFQELFASSVPLIGKLDPKRVKTTSHDLLDASPELLAAVLGGDAASSATKASGTDETPAKKAGKRRKN
jgi:signal peptidase complex subunit 2